MIKNGRKYRILTDHKGSVRMVVDTHDWEIVQQTEYSPFGMIIDEQLDEGWEPVLFGYAGGLQDRDTGLVRFGARDYDPETARWTSKEPLGFNGASNFYVYAGNDPVNFVDPDGNFAFMTALAVGWAIFEVASSIYDIVDTFQTLLDPCETDLMKGIALGGLALGIIAPGGGYGKVGKEGAEFAAKHADDVMRHADDVTGNIIEKIWKVRKSKGGDNAISGHIIEKIGDETVSKTHRVIKNGEIIHQHQSHIGKYGSIREFAEEWIEYKTIK